MTQTQIDRECPLHWDTQNPVTLIEHDIDRLMQLIPGLPAWAAHQICGWDWAAIGAMLNANVTLNTVSDDGSVSGTLARQARLNAIALSEAIALLKWENQT